MSQVCLSNSTTPPQLHYCLTSTPLKISLFVAGLLLILGAVLCHVFHVNSIAAYTLGFGGALLAVAPLILCVVERVLLNRAEEKELEEQRAQREKEQAELKEKERFYVLAKNGDKEAIQEALANGKAPELEYLLQGAASEGQVDLVSHLLDQGADPRLVAKYDHLGYSALHLATCGIKSGGIEIMKILLDKDPTLVSVRGEFRDLTPLHLSVFNFDNRLVPQKVKLLLEKGADPNLQASDGNTPLHEALTDRFGDDPDIEVIEMLARAGADWNIKNAAGQTPLQVAQRYHPKWCADPEIQKRLQALTQSK